MLAATHTDEPPGTVIHANDKRRARLEAIRHLVLQIDYAEKNQEIVGEPDQNIIGQGPDFDNT